MAERGLRSREDGDVVVVVLVLVRDEDADADADADADGKGEEALVQLLNIPGSALVSLYAGCLTSCLTELKLAGDWWDVDRQDVIVVMYGIV